MRYGREGATHLSGDLETLWESRLLKNYVDSFCTETRLMILGFVEDGVKKEVPGTHGVVTRTQESRSRQVDKTMAGDECLGDERVPKILKSSKW